MKKIVTYLVGSIQDSTDPNASRDRVEKKLTEDGFEVLNPCKLECNTTLAGTIEEQKTKLKNLKKAGRWDHFDEIMDAIIDSDLVCVTRSNFIIVFWDNTKKHGGTIDEILLAASMSKPILVVHNGLVDMNDWVLRRIRRTLPLGTKFFQNNTQLIDYIEEKYEAYVKEHGTR